MAKLFKDEPFEEEEGIVKRFPLFFKILASLVVVVICITSIVSINEREKKEKYKNNKNMLVELLKMDNGNVLALKVKYGTVKKVDPKDTSDLFFEIVIGNDLYKKGDLIKYNHRFIQEQEFEGVTYCIIDASQIQCHLEKKDVKEDIIKR